ncbi:MAG: hypothetical protein AB7U79_02485 [Candidatus Izemoplasmatales bacterium]
MMTDPFQELIQSASEEKDRELALNHSWDEICKLLRTVPFHLTKVYVDKSVLDSAERTFHNIATGSYYKINPFEVKTVVFILFLSISALQKFEQQEIKNSENLQFFVNGAKYYETLLTEREEIKYLCNQYFPSKSVKDILKMKDEEISKIAPIRKELVNEMASVNNEYRKDNETYLVNNTLQDGCLIIHIGTYMYKETNSFGQTHSKKVALVFKNISSKRISAFHGVIRSNDAFGNALESTPFKLYDLEKFVSGEYIGERTFFEIPTDAVSFKIYVVQIVFTDKSSVLYSDYKTIEKSDILFLINEEEYPIYNYFWTQFNNSYPLKYNYFKTMNLILCPCGAINHSNNIQCVDCGADFGLLDKRFSIIQISDEIRIEAQSRFDSLIQSSPILMDTEEDSIRQQISSYGIDFLLDQIKTAFHITNQNEDIINDRIGKIIGQDIYQFISEKKEYIEQKDSIFTDEIIAEEHRQQLEKEAYRKQRQAQLEREKREKRKIQSEKTKQVTMKILPYIIAIVVGLVILFAFYIA